MMKDAGTVQTPMWRPSRIRSVLGVVAYPVVLLLNRPSLAWFADLLYDLALRCSGVAITFGGTQGLTRAEENFLRRIKGTLQGGVLFDIGANNGAYSDVLNTLAPTASIYAFEPHAATFARLKAAMVHRTGVHIVNKAVADKAGVLQLYDFRSEDGSTQASLSKSAVDLYSSDIVEQTIECTTVDAFMAETGLDHIDLLKIDTEGHDLSVLLGAEKALRDCKIRMIQFEFIPANIATGVTMHAFFKVLSGYRIGRMCLNGTIRWLDAYDVKRCEIYVTHNLIAVPR